MKHVVSYVKVPFDVLFNVATSKGIESPVMCLPTGEWQVAMDESEYTYDRAIDAAMTADANLVLGHKPSVYKKGDEEYHVYLLNIDGHEYYFVYE